MPALSKAARPARVLLQQPAFRVARRSLGDSVAGPPVTDLAANFQRACEFFTKTPLNYSEFKQQCNSLRLFVFAGVTTGCMLALIVSPPKSSYWMRWGPSYWYPNMKGVFGASSPPLFLAEKSQHSSEATAAYNKAVGGAPKKAAAAAAPVVAAPAADSVADLERRVAELEVHKAAEVHSAFVFIKPHAVCNKVKELVKLKLEAENVTILSEGCIPAEQIDSKQLIDTHYGAIAAKAVKQKPDSLTVSAKAQDEFKKAFGMAWQDALSQGIVYNAMDAASKLGISTDELGAKWGTLKKGSTLLKFGGGFYCGKVGDIFVINGFYMDMRSKFTTPGTSIYYYTVEWSPRELSWADFRNKVLGTTDPATAELCSMRHLIYSNWTGLGLKSKPDTGDNGVHASASPFEALAERNNWLGVPLAEDRFGRAMLSTGVPCATVKKWCDDPAVPFEGKKQSLFDLLEDLDSGACLKKAQAINSAGA